MVDDIVKVANILSQPDLEESTKASINQYLRDQVKALGESKKTPPADMPPDIMKEWLEGSPKGGGS